MMASPLSRNEISELLECAICLEMVKNPRRLACEHFFCKRCLDKLLVFNTDGSCLIKCPKRCTKDTLIPNNSTTNDLGVDYLMNGMIEMLANNVDSSLLTKHKRTCDANPNCNKEISFFCPYCNLLLCKSCHCCHDNAHCFPVSYDPNEEQIKVLCVKHSTDATYMCCEPCNNMFICVYCLHRDHVGHSYDIIANQFEKMKEDLKNGVDDIKSYNRKLDDMLQQTESDISVARYVLDETLMYRKMLCLTEYLHFLNKEEERINAQFYSITVNHRKPFNFKEEFKELFMSMESGETVTTAMQIKSALNYSSLCNKVNITEEILGLSGHCFNSSYPLGNLTVEPGKSIPVDISSKSFKSRLVNMGDNSMRNDALSLHENLQYLLQKCLPKTKASSCKMDRRLFENLVEENDKLKDELVKLNEENKQILTANNEWEKDYQSLKQKYDKSKDEFDESVKQFMKKVEELEDVEKKYNRLIEKLHEQVDASEDEKVDGNGEEVLTDDILMKLSQRNQKQKIVEQLLPLVMEIQPFSFNYVMDILLKLDNNRLLNMLESSKLLQDEIDIALKHFKRQRDKESVARYVDRAISNDVQVLYSLELMNLSEKEPLTSSSLTTLSTREQKQLIGERLFPVLQKTAPTECPYIMDVLLRLENEKLLDMLESHNVLCAEVEKSVLYVKKKTDKARVARYVTKALRDEWN